MEEFICRYPFDAKKYKVKILKPKGEFAHENFPESRYAVDFELPLGVPVLAAEKGMVSLVRCNSNAHFLPAEVEPLSIEEKIRLATDYTNIVGIRHNEIYTEYAHLAKRKVVSKDHFVKGGDVIGYVGLFGIADLPHLHFNACIIENRKGISIPVRFKK